LRNVDGSQTVAHFQQYHWPIMALAWGAADLNLEDLR
jgi:hypothetical protein